MEYLRRRKPYPSVFKRWSIAFTDLIFIVKSAIFIPVNRHFVGHERV